MPDGSWAAARLGMAAPVVFLAASLTLIGVLTWQAFAAARDHRALAERVLHDYADLAGTELVRRGSTFVFTYGFDVLTRALVTAHREGKLPSRQGLAAALPPASKRAIELVGSLIRVNMWTSRIETDGEAVPEGVQRVLMSSLRSPYKTGTPATVITSTLDGRPRLFAFATDPIEQGSESIYLGFETPLDALAAWLQEFVLRDPLLPPSLVARETARSAVAIALLGPDDQPILGSPLPVSNGGFSVTRPWMDEPSRRFLPGITVVTAIDPAAASSLIIGGLPESRVMPLMALLALAAALAIASVVQLRRERSLASMREDFVTRTSHELRTPIARIRVFTETLLLNRVRTDAERHDAVRAIDRAARRLSMLVENVLQFSRSTMLGVPVHTEHTDISALVRDAVAELETSVNADRRIMVDATPSSYALVDRDALRQAVINLLDNAWKYSNPHQPVTAQVTSTGAELQIRISDAGPGIPERDRLRIWDPYVRLDRDRRSAVAGTGIGLSVVRDIVTAHHGRCWVETSQAGGAAFVIALPVAPAQPATSASVA